MEDVAGFFHLVKERGCCRTQQARRSRHDAPQALPLLGGLALAYPIADRDYDFAPLVAVLAVIPL